MECLLDTIPKDVIYMNEGLAEAILANHDKIHRGISSNETNINYYIESPSARKALVIEKMKKNL